MNSTSFELSCTRLIIAVHVSNLTGCSRRRVTNDVILLENTRTCTQLSVSSVEKEVVEVAYTCQHARRLPGTGQSSKETLSLLDWPRMGRQDGLDDHMAIFLIKSSRSPAPI